MPCVSADCLEGMDLCTNKEKKLWKHQKYQVKLEI